MNKSIYTEYANLTPYNIKYLDGCGATWAFGGEKFSEWNRSQIVSFSESLDGGAWNFFGDKCRDYTHLPTGDAFCQGVADILGIEYVPEVDISKTETTTEDKGLAIDVKLLSEGDRGWIVDNIQFGHRLLNNALSHSAAVGYLDGMGWSEIVYYERVGHRITTDPNEFMRYVADKTGKEWEPVNGKLMNDSDIEAIIDLIGTPPTYPHKTYRVLDSLDGVPFDTRIPLSEWVPPFGVEVLFIFKEKSLFSSIMKIYKNGLAFDNNMIGANWKHFDGHWMRIV